MRAVEATFLDVDLEGSIYQTLPWPGIRIWFGVIERVVQVDGNLSEG